MIPPGLDDVVALGDDAIVQRGFHRAPPEFAFLQCRCATRQAKSHRLLRRFAGPLLGRAEPGNQIGELIDEGPGERP